MKDIPTAIIIICCLFSVNAENYTHSKAPKVMIVSLLRNKAHILPYFFSYLERLDYPKERISLWFRSDHNEDNTTQIIFEWLFSSSRHYHHVDFDYENETVRRTTEISPTHWPEERHLDVIKLKEEAFNCARGAWADYVFFLDADVLLIHAHTLTKLISYDKPVVAPMLLSDLLYSNFWCGMSEDFYYERTSDYIKIYQFEQQGIFAVPMIHSAVLVNLNDKRSDNLTFNRTILTEKLAQNVSMQKSLPHNVPVDDIIIFALAANYSGIPLYLTNEVYGFGMVPLEPNEGLSKDLEQLANIKIQIINDIDGGLVLNNKLAKFVQYPAKTMLTLSKIYMINLIRRPERRQKMQQSFQEIGLLVDEYPAIDGAQLTDEILEENDIRFLHGYADPYHNRPMTTGEVGCFLSHYYIWKTMVEQNLQEILILEDDIRFEHNFVEKANKVINDARRIGGWDLIYLGRKRLEKQDEQWVEDSNVLVHPGYSYWTLGYILTLAGARKLLDAKPLEKLVPVDEFLPIMFDKHVNSTWKETFANRNLIAWSAAPLLLFPTYYTGEDGFISDTEDSAQIIIQQEENIDLKIDTNELNFNAAEINREVQMLKEAIDDVLAEKSTSQPMHTEL